MTRPARAPGPDRAALLAALAAVADGVVLAAPSGTVTFANAAAARLTGIAADAAAGRPLAELLRLRRRVPGGPDPLAVAPVDGADSAAPVAAFLTGADGRELPVTCRAARSGGPAASRGGTMVVLVDGREPPTPTTEAQQLQVQLMQADRMASVGTLAAGVAHEINNPLAYVLANLEYLAGELQDVAAAAPDERMTEVLQALQEAREGAERVRHIVRDLKTFSRPNEEQSGPVDLRRVLEASINMVFNEIKHRARLVKDYGPSPPVEANESRLGQVFLNLLLNAAQAIRDGATDTNRIRLVTGTDAQGRAVVEVHDTGAGMSPEVMARIFDPFFTTKPIGVGTGLGLPICRSIVEALGGVIEVASEPGTGTMFRVTLPPASARPADAPPPVSAAGGGRRGRILVIDDEPMVLSAVRRCLAPEHQVVTESNATAALHRLREGERFDLVICDLMMPQVSGIDLYEELQATEPGWLERLVFLTGGAFTPRAREFLDTVPTARMEKPFEGPQLLALVRSLLG